jgi:uncharacterized PurR-regulated membrane protein YhhQ (DUF165 family)
MKAGKYHITNFSGKRLMLTKRQKVEGSLFLAGFILCVPAANWMIGNLGTTCPPGEPCLVPVAPGIMAPSGVVMIGLALVLRDLVQRRLGVNFAAIGILIGAVLSAFIVPPALVIASATAFLFSEFADLAVFTPLQKRGLVLAVFVSSVVGLVVDSLLFLWLAFGSFDFLTGQIIGKAWMVLIALPFVHLIRQRDKALGLEVA